MIGTISKDMIGSAM